MPLSPGEHPLDSGARPQLEPEVLQTIVTRWSCDKHREPEYLSQGGISGDNSPASEQGGV